MPIPEYRIAMSGILRPSEAASLALHTVVLLAAYGNRLATTSQIAPRLRASEAHLSKVLQRPAKAGLVTSSRGPKGGYSLPKESRKTTLLGVYQAIEGALQPSDHLLSTRICLGDRCIFAHLLPAASLQIRDYLARTTLRELMQLFGKNNAHATHWTPPHAADPRAGTLAGVDAA